MPEPHRQPVYGHDRWEVDLARRELRARGVLVPMGGRAFDLLEALVMSAGDLITKDDLMRRVWSGAIVEENTLQVHISAVRKALGPDRNLLKTVSGRGYRLLGNWVVRQEGASLGAVATEHSDADGRPFFTNIPVAASALIGREVVVQHLRNLLSAYRIVTLTGTGGIGKTVLAAEVARRLFPDAACDVVLIELVSLTNASLVPSVVASALSLNLGDGEVSAANVARAIGDRRIMLVLDNCEHVIAEAAEMAETLIRLCPRATLLATSREVLRVDGEFVYRVPALEVPPQTADEPANVVRHSAVQLFITRTGALRTDLAGHDVNLPLIAAICRRLDGIPLAIEFAAARAATLGLDQVAARLDDRFGLLTDGRRTALPRHQTLRATLDWSYELLPAQEQCLLRRLAVFPAGFTLEAATAIIRDVIADPSAVISGVVNLVTKSLVTPDPSAPAGRWRLLESIRAYALEKLAASNEALRAAQLHAAFFRDLVVSSAPTSRQDSSLHGLQLCYREVDNVRAALDWAFSAAGDSRVGIALTAAYVPVWLHYSWHKECRDRTEHALAVLGRDVEADPASRMQLLAGLGMVTLYAMRAPDKIVGILSEVLLLAEHIDDIDAQLRTLWALWLLHVDTGHIDAAHDITARFASVGRRAGDPASILVADRLAAYTLQFGGDHPAAQRAIDRALDQYGVPMSERHRIWFLHDQHIAVHDLLARSLWLRGFVDQAAAQARVCLAKAEETENSLTICEAIRLAMGPISLATGDFAVAARAIAALRDHAARHNTTYWKIAERCLQGELQIRRGLVPEGIALLKDALGTCEASGWAICYPWFKGVLAEGYVMLGQSAEALGAVAQALAAAERSGERWSVPELLRIKGECHLMAAADRSEAMAEDCFVAALDVAARQGALFWQLRAAMSLARLRISQGAGKDAIQGLAQVYNDFTEGFATPDLESARELLTSLSAASPHPDPPSASEERE